MKSKNRSDEITRMLEGYQRVHASILEKYGRRCTCCGEQSTLALALDRTDVKMLPPEILMAMDVMIDGGDPLILAKGFMIFYKGIVRQKYPVTYQARCMNCIVGRYQNGGVCPHQDRAYQKSRTK